MNIILNLNRNPQLTNHNNMVELEVPDQSFIFRSRITTIVKMIGIVKVDKCHNFLTFQNEDHHQRYIKERKLIHLMIKFHSKEEPIQQPISFKLKFTNRVIKNLRKNIRKKPNLLKLNLINVFSLKIIKITTN